MKKAVAIWLGLAAAIGQLPANAQDVIGSAEQDAAFLPVAAETDGSPYDFCKRDAFTYGVMGHYRRLYILSCLDTDMTSAIETRD
jgi:hypothetical protein